MQTFSKEVREQLAAQAATDDREAFNRLAAFYRQSLLQYVRKRVQSVEDAEDLVQETLLKAWLHRRSYVAREGGSWYAWCRRIADRLWADTLRRARVVEFVSMDGRLPEGETDAPWEIPPAASEESASEERIAALRLASRRLPPRQRRILELLVEGYRVPEIAAALCLPAQTVRIYLSRARKTVRKHIGS